MPEFLVTAPDGMKLRLKGPEGSTFEDAVKIAQKKYTPTPKPSGYPADRVTTPKPPEAAPPLQAPPPADLRQAVVPRDERAAFEIEQRAAQTGGSPQIDPAIQERIRKNLANFKGSPQERLENLMQMTKAAAAPVDVAAHPLALAGDKDSPGMRRSLQNAHLKPTGMAPGQKPWTAAGAVERLKAADRMGTLEQRLIRVAGDQGEEASWADSVAALPAAVKDSLRQAGLGPTRWLAKAFAYAPGPVGDAAAQLETWAKTQAQLSEEQRMRAVPENQTFLQKAFNTAGVSIVESVPLLMTGLITKAPWLVASGFGLLETGRSISEGLQKGLDLGSALNYGVLNGFIEGGTEYLPAVAVLKRGSPFLKRVVEFMAREIPGEITAETSQRLAQDYYGLAEENMTVKEWLAIVAATSAATLMGGGVQATALHGGVKVAESVERRRVKKYLEKLFHDSQNERKSVREDVERILEEEEKRRKEAGEPPIEEDESLDEVQQLQKDIEVLEGDLTAKGEAALEEIPDILQRDRLNPLGQKARARLEPDETGKTPEDQLVSNELGRGSQLGDNIISWSTHQQAVNKPVVGSELPAGSVSVMGDTPRKRHIAEIEAAIKADPKGEAATKYKPVLKALKQTQRRMERQQQAVAKVIQQLVQKYSPKMKIVLLDESVVPADDRRFGFSSHGPSGVSYIALNFDRAAQLQGKGNEQAAVYGTLAHEFGHALIAHEFVSAPNSVRAALYAEYDKWTTAQAKRPAVETSAQLRGPLEGAVLDAPNFKSQEQFAGEKGFSELPEGFAQITSFDEYAAMRIAQILSEGATGRKSATKGDRFWRGLATKLKSLWDKYISRSKNQWGVDSFAQWVDLLAKRGQLTQLATREGPAKVEEMTEESKGPAALKPIITDNADPLGDLEGLTPRQRAVLRNLMPPELAERVRKSSTKYNNFLRYALTLTQIARENAHIAEITEYTEHVREWWAEKSQWTDRANETLEQWAKLMPDEATQQRFARFVHAATLESDELGRKLTVDEKLTLGKAVGLDLEKNTELRQFYMRVQQDFHDAISALMDVLRKDARIRWSNDIEALMAAEKNIDEEERVLLNRDYFPLSRFGKHGVVVRAEQELTYKDRTFQKGDTILYELYETKKDAQKRIHNLHAQFGARASISPRKVEEEEYGFQGMPQVLLRRLEELLDEDQKKALQQILHEMAPGQSYKHSLQRRKGTLGFSMDAPRGYANYFMHFANHISRINHYHEMKGAIQKLKERADAVWHSAGGTVEEADRLRELQNHLDRHYQYAMNPGNEWSSLRAVGFLWYIGFVPKSAIVNLTQIPMVTAAYLGNRYGDLKMTRYLLASMKRARQLWTNGTGLSPDESAAVERAVEAGFINESQATDLASVAEGSNLFRLMPGKLRKGEAAAKKVRTVAAAAGHWFQTVEMFNRYITFDAAYRLERDKILQGRDDEKLPEMERMQLYERAFLAGREAVENTQYEYARWNRAEFMRGRKSSLFLFMQYLQNSLYFQLRGSGKMRFFLAMAVLAGLQGFPGAEMIFDLLDFFKQKGRNEFGLSGDPYSDVRTELRELFQELDANPDLMMHGISRYGPGSIVREFGLPAPRVDISGSLSLGSPIPGWDPIARFATGKTQDLSGAAHQATTDVVGAAYGGLWDIMAAVAGNDQDMWKRAERAAPTTVKNISKAARWATRGKETDPSGATLVEFDKDNPEHWMEIAAQAAGFTPTRLSVARERNWAGKEMARYYAGRRAIIMKQYDLAREANDREAEADVMKAVRHFNENAPKGMQLSLKAMAQSHHKRRLNRRKTERDQPLRQKDAPEYRRVLEAYPRLEK